MKQVDIFKNEGIQVIDSYERDSINNDEEWSQFIDKDNIQTPNQVSEENLDSQTYHDESIDNDTDNEWCEETERPSVVMDTLLQEPDIV